jgi:hypothetical protein
MPDSDFVLALAKRINVSLDIPFLSETQEQVYILWMVGKVAPRIPQSIKDFIFDAADGISPEELGRLEDVLVNVLNQYIDLPILGESAEAMLIRPVVSAVLDLASDGLSIEEPSEI